MFDGSVAHKSDRGDADKVFYGDATEPDRVAISWLSAAAAAAAAPTGGRPTWRRPLSWLRVKTDRGHD